MLYKFLALIALIAVVWYAFRWVGRVQQVKAKTASKVEKARAERAAGVEDMIQCARCRAFVPSGSAMHCGREDCPYPHRPD